MDIYSPKTREGPAAPVGMLPDASSPPDRYSLVLAGTAETRSESGVTIGLASILNPRGPLLMIVIVIKEELSITVLSLLFKKCFLSFQVPFLGA